MSCAEIQTTELIKYTESAKHLTNACCLLLQVESKPSEEDVAHAEIESWGKYLGLFQMRNKI